MKTLTYVEIDVDYCALSYGTSPCTASIPTTGAIKCFNTLVSCQDRENFDNAPATLRFAVPTDYLPDDIDCIPSIKDVSFTPAVISLGEDLGMRATLSITFEDHRHADTGDGFDKYHAERPYNPYNQGTFWGKFRARQPFLIGRSLRLIRGHVGQTLEDMEVHHYVMESFDGPTPQGTFRLVAQDVLKLADNDRAQAPLLSQGLLSGTIDADDASLNALPAGIGNSEYPASGHLCIGGKEIVAFTRSDDAFTITRGQFGTEAVAHSADERLQLVLRYEGEDPADIIADLLENYAGVPSGFIPVAAWLNETENFLQRVYTATITEPTGVNKLISELVEQAALAVWWDDQLQQIRLQVLRQIATTADRFDGGNMLESTFRTKEQPEKRLSQVWTYFGQRDPTRKLDQVDNFRSAAATVDLESQSDYGAPAIKKIFSRWIPFGGRTVALRLNDIVLGRYVTPPRRFEWELLKVRDDGSSQIIAPGGGYRVEGWSLQDLTGAPTDAPVQVTMLNPMSDRIAVEAEEAIFRPFDPDDLTNRVVIVDSNFNNFNLLDAHDSIFPEVTDADVIAGVTLTCIVEAGVIVGSSSIGTPAFVIPEDWPDDFLITLKVIGRIQGRGGKGDGGVASTGPEAGGTALHVRFPIDLDIDEGEIFGGGGGGGGSFFFFNLGGGGGGAGQLPGAAGAGAAQDESVGQPGTTEAGGAGATGAGAGGGPGLAGVNGGGTGGAAGNAIDGESFVTVTEGPGDIRGGQVN